jgi:Dolichyl-phosphate-mannose-protein mannosyltransferase
MSTMRVDAAAVPRLRSSFPTWDLLGRIDTRWQVAVLAVLAAYFMVYPAWRLAFPIEIDLNEGFNAYLADAAMGAGPLYPPPDTLTLNNYPPLSFYVVGGLAQIFGDPLYVGRALSLLAVLALGGLIAATIRQLGGGRAGAAVGGLWFVAVMARSFSRYVGMDDPQLVGHALMMGGLVWFMVREARDESVVPAILAMVAAGFYKHNVVAVPVTALTWLALKDWRRAIAPAVIGAGAAALGFAICVAIYGDAFLTNFFTPRIHEAMRAIYALGRAQFILPALVLWGIWITAEPRSPAARFTTLFIATGLAAFVIQSAGDGVDDNAQFDLVIATAVGLGLAFDRSGKTAFGERHGKIAAQAVVVLVVALRLLATLRIEPALVLFDPDYRAEYIANAQVVRDEAARIAEIPGPVVCATRVVCRLAGKPFSFDPFRANTMVKTGASGGLDVDGLIRAHGMIRVGGDPRQGIQALYRSIVGNP